MGMRRREFVTLLSGAAVWPHAARAQQLQQVRRIGMLMLVSENDAQAHAERAGLTGELQRLRWVEGFLGHLYDAIDRNVNLAPDQCCSSVRKFLPRRRPHMTQNGHFDAGPTSNSITAGFRFIVARE